MIPTHLSIACIIQSGSGWEDKKKRRRKPPGKVPLLSRPSCVGEGDWRIEYCRLILSKRSGKGTWPFLREPEAESGKKNNNNNSR